MYSGYGDDDGMMDSLRHYVRRHKDYNPQADLKLTDEDRSLVSIAIFQNAAHDAYTNPKTSWSDIFTQVLPKGGLLTLYGLLVSGFETNMSPDDGGGGGYIPHKGYIDNLHAMNDRSLKRTIRSLEQNIDEHLDKLATSPDSLAVPHWQSEIRNWQEELQLALEEAARRGMK